MPSNHAQSITYSISFDLHLNFMLLLLLLSRFSHVRLCVTPYVTALDVVGALARARNKTPSCLYIAVDVLFSQFWGIGLWA